MVCVGASAGGLDAFKRFFSRMQADSGMAFVLIQHLDPDHESLTETLLARHTQMKVKQVTARTPVEPNRVYVIPPKKYLSIRNRVLHLTVPPHPRGARTPIDFFLLSLANDLKEKAICVILSGTGSDGTIGLKAIKEQGGLVAVQDPQTAQYDGMPRSAIATGVVDFVLDAESIPEKLIRYVEHPYVNGAVETEPETELHRDFFNEILALLRTRTKSDFHAYKRTTLHRRIQRRMGINHIETPAEYLDLLRRSPDEVKTLFKDLLIGVTAFFREPEAFRVLERGALYKLIQSKPPDDPLRAWVPGCATGEEAYSLAILLLEQTTAVKRHAKFQVFASDLNEEAVRVARHGLYPESIAAHVSRERLTRFFTLQGAGYRVNKELREVMVFAQQNLIIDPPYSKIDLISCRNLLIYLDAAVQPRIISLFHYALNPGGLLLLGQSETLGRQSGLFETVSQKWRVYRRLDAAQKAGVVFPIIGEAPSRTAVQAARRKDERPLKPAEITRELLLSAYAPAAVLVDGRFHILYYHGPTGRYLDMPTGEPTQDLLSLTREGLRPALRNALHKAGQSEQRTTALSGRIPLDGEERRVVVTAVPVGKHGGKEGLLLVTFEDEVVPQKSETRDEGEGSNDVLVRQLEQELKAAREDLVSTTEEMQAANEELNASNEEVMSMNEELQSANEELESSKEELQSLNEELNTINAELQEKMEDLDTINNDLINLLASTDVATIFLDTRYRINRFTPAAQELFNLIPADVGRPLDNITPKFADEDLTKDAQSVLESHVSIQKEIRSQDGCWYTRRILPYRTQDNRIEGLVFTFTNVTALKQVEAQSEEARINAEGIVQTVREPLIVLNQELRVVSANEAFYRTFRTTPSETQGNHFYHLNNGQWEIPGLRVFLERVSPKDEKLEDFEVALDLQGSGRRAFMLNARRLVRGEDRPWQVLLAIEDITSQKQWENHLAETIWAEHEKMGRELSDSLGQDLTAGALLAEALRKQSGDRSPETLKKLEEILLSLQRKLRGLIGGFEPMVVTAEGGLDGWLEALATATEWRFGIRCAFHGPESAHPLDKKEVTTLYRIAYEAVSNAVRHSQAGSIQISLESRPEGFVLEVRDDGVGFPPNMKRNLLGMGLRIMRSRAETIGASLTVEGSKEGGTTVRCVLPPRGEQK